MERRELALALIEWRDNLDALQAELDKFPWDCAKPLVTLQPVHISRAIEKYLRNEVSDKELVAWAESVEGRDDIRYSESYEELIAHVLFRISTPAINNSINEHIAKELLYELSVL